jgi:hypothetical protein
MIYVQYPFFSSALQVRVSFGLLNNQPARKADNLTAICEPIV